MSDLHLVTYLSESENLVMEELATEAKGVLKTLQTLPASEQFDGAFAKELGWFDLSEWANQEQVDRLEELARQMRAQADTLVVVGVGGSNQGARGILTALEDETDREVLYLGNNLSEREISKVLNRLKGKSVCFNVIAKNFATLEPGLAFRLCRQFVMKEYPNENNSKRFIVTGSQGSILEELAEKEGFYFLEFPSNIGGRFSLFSNVGLFPIAFGGLDISVLVQEAKVMQVDLMAEPPEKNIAYQYAVARNSLLTKGYQLECLAYFEPSFDYFARWWRQLFAESEGKNNRGLFPINACYSEDLHSIGQYVQEGQKILFETVVEVQTNPRNLELKGDHVVDNFSYLDNKKLAEINQVALEATVMAHREAGVPIVMIKIPDISIGYLGQLCYLMEFSCYLSAIILGVHPFDQAGVENYKKHMFSRLMAN